MDPPYSNGVSQEASSTAMNGHSIRHDTVDPETLFDALNQTYSDAYEDNAAQVRCIEKLLSMLSPGSHVLDIGSGTGLPVTSMLASAGMNVVGIDKSAAMINAARANVPTAKFYRCDMRQYRPPKDEKYDAIVANLSILMVSTSTIREMAFKMAHWLKPGGLLMLGIIDWTDVDQASGWSADSYNEWLNHHFMGQVIKDNLFGVGQWINLLRSADIALVNVKGAVFEAADSGILVEPECFFIGRKGDKEALMGPLRFPTDFITGITHGMMPQIEQHIVTDKDGLERLLDGIPEIVDLSGSIITHDERLMPHKFETVTAENQVPSTHHLRNSHSIVLYQPSPSNDFVTILNNVATFFNLPTIHAGAGLQAAVKQLRSAGFKNLQMSLLGDEFLNFAHSKDIIEDASQIAMEAFTAHRNTLMWQALDLAVKAQLERYLANMKNFGNRADGIGFQRVVVIARRD